jgi:hypothetical protein
VPTGQVFGKYDFGDVYQNSWENPNLVKIELKYWTLYMKA